MFLVYGDYYFDYHKQVGMDWLLWGIFAVMGVILLAGANIKIDIFMIIAASLGGFILEGWGTQTRIWIYYSELAPYYDHSRPPLWIIPAWPISCLAINRMYIFVDILIKNVESKRLTWLYWPIWLGFCCVMIDFAKHTLHMPFTWAMIVGIACFTFRPGDKRKGVVLFIVASVLGYFLEYWGTSRTCWIYYTREVPPLAAVLGHGAASVLFARVALQLEKHWQQIREMVQQ